jgi:type I restriction enzyme S subunit
MTANASSDSRQSFRLGEIAAIRYGKAKPSQSGDVPVIGSGGVYGSTVEALADETAIVVGRKGTAGSVYFPNRPSWPSDTTFYVEPNVEVVIPEFLALLLLDAQLSGEHARTTMPSLQKSQLTDLVVVLPVRDEQLKIVEILSTIQRSKELTDQELAIAKGVRSSFLATLLRHIEKSAKDELQSTEYGALPAHWQLLPLEQICDLVVDCPHTKPHFLKEGVLVLRNFNIRNGEINLDRAFFTSEEEYDVRTARARPLEGDIVFSREAPVGEACIIPPNTRLSLGQRTMLLRARKEIILSEYLLGMLYTPELQAFMKLRSTGVTAPHLNVADVRRMMIPVPPLNEQGQAIRALEAMRRSIQARRQVALCLEHLYKGTLNRFMVGIN